MPKPDITAGDPCWIDLMTSDPEKAKDFYTGLFGWTYETGDAEKYGGYIMAFKNGAPVAGMMKNEGDSGYPDVWTTYLWVEDINATADAAAAQAARSSLPRWRFRNRAKWRCSGTPGAPPSARGSSAAIPASSSSLIPVHLPGSSFSPATTTPA